MEKHVPTFDQFLNERTLADHEAARDKNDWGYTMIFREIEEHLGKAATEIEELSSVENYVDGEKNTAFSTAEKGNFVLNCGESDGTPCCRLLDELNDVITFYK
jgi:hypothetical protein